jgi:hypothetical protein
MNIISKIRNRKQPKLVMVTEDEVLMEALILYREHLVKSHDHLEPKEMARYAICSAKIHQLWSKQNL